MCLCGTHTLVVRRVVHFVCGMMSACNVLGLKIFSNRGFTYIRGFPCLSPPVLTSVCPAASSEMLGPLNDGVTSAFFVGAADGASS